MCIKKLDLIITYRILDEFLTWSKRKNNQGIEEKFLTISAYLSLAHSSYYLKILQAIFFLRTLFMKINIISAAFISRFSRLLNNAFVDLQLEIIHTGPFVLCLPGTCNSSTSLKRVINCNWKHSHQCSKLHYIIIHNTSFICCLHRHL